MHHRVAPLVFVPAFVLGTVAGTAAQSSPRNTILLSTEARTMAAPTSWDESAAVTIRFDSEPEDRCMLRLTYLWHDEVKEPDRIELPEATTLAPPGCPKPANGQTPPLVFTVPRHVPDRAMLTYMLWRLVPAAQKPLAQIRQTIDTSRKTLQVKTILPTDSDLLTNKAAEQALLTEINNGARNAADTIESLGRTIETQTRTVANFEADAKLFTGTSDPAGITAVRDILAQLQKVRTELHTSEDQRRALRERQKDLQALGTQINEYALAIRQGQAICQRASILKIGGVLPSERSKSVYYDFARSTAPPGFALQLMSGYPRITQDDKLFAIVANRRVADHRYSFILSATKAITAPPNLAPVRPTFDVVKAIEGGSFRVWTKTAGKLPPGCPPDTIPIDTASLTTAYRDSVLPFQDRFVGNDVLTVSISTYIPATASDKVTTTVEGSKTAEKKETVVESKVVKLLDDVKYPQVRALYRFNFASGIVVSRVKETTYTRLKTAVNNPDTSQVDEARYVLHPVEGTTRIFPSFLFSTYIKRADIQEPVWVPCKGLGRCPGWRAFPAPSIGFAINNPADNVFAGITSELFENIHVFAGWHNGKISELIVRRDDQGNEIPITDVERESADPKTQFVRKWDRAFGITFNINIVGTFFK